MTAVLQKFMDTPTAEELWKKEEAAEALFLRAVKPVFCRALELSVEYRKRGGELAGPAPVLFVTPAERAEIQAWRDTATPADVAGRPLMMCGLAVEVKDTAT